MTPEELRSALEAILFVAGEPITVDELTEAFTDASREEIEAQLEEIRKRFEDLGGVSVEKTAGGYRLATRPEFDPFLRKFFAKKSEGRLSIAALETLAIIAYRQPVTAPEISEIRGVNTSGVLRTLLERKLVRIAGRKNVVGSPFLYRTTKEFLVHFGLDHIQDLPQLEEFADILGENVAEDFLAIGDAMARGAPDADEPMPAATDSQASVETGTAKESTDSDASEISDISVAGAEQEPVESR